MAAPGESVSARDAAVWGAIALAAVNGAAGLYGGLRWYLRSPSRDFWFALRGAQGLALAYAALVAVLLIDHHPPSSGIYYLYALLPIAIGFVAEQLRLVAADQVLTARGLDDAKEVGRLAVADQQEVVLAILRREMGVMALAAIVVCFLALRAAGTY